MQNEVMFEIIDVKILLEKMKEDGLLKEWDLVYENLLTRLSASLFFLTPVSEESLSEIWHKLRRYGSFTYKKNEKYFLSDLAYCIEFKNR